MLDADISTRDALRHLHRREAPDPHTLDRRQFLQLVGMGLGAGLVAGGASSLLDELLLGHDPSAWAAGPVGTNDGILVVIGMFGGNDGLNTVVPFGDGNYVAQHGALAMARDQTLPITGDTGIHPALTSLKGFWDRGQLAVVQGVGYPEPDLSHFNSMAYWMAGRPNAIPTSGWLGRWLDGHLAGAPDLFAAAEIGHSLPLHLVGASRRGTVVPEHRSEFGSSTEPRDERMYAAIRSMVNPANGAWQTAVSQAYVDQLDLAATLAPEFVDELPDVDIVARLEVAARMINANLGFRVLTAGWGDFDSHANQPDMHPTRMAELNAAVARFFDVLDPAWESRVTVMTFSEFGRTSHDNDGAGTDHGTAAPHFVFGQNVRGGLYGAPPSLAGLRQWDRMAHTVDFRSYYASIIDGWLGGGSSTVLGGSFENLGLFARAPGVNADGSPAALPAIVSPPSTFVPVEPFRALDTRTGEGGVAVRPVNAGESIRVPIAGLRSIPPTGVTAVAANVTSVLATEPNYFTVFPGTTARPGTSNLNSGPGRPVPNLVVMGVGADGTIEVFNSHGNAHCVVDVFGYYTEGAGERFTAVDPARLFDTRTGLGVRPGKVASGAPVEVQVAGLAGVPASGATAVVMNLTVTEADSMGWMKASPTGAITDTSNVNFYTGDTVPNLTITKLGTGGRITIEGLGSGAHVVGDVFGYFGPTGTLMRTVAPKRMLDTRDGLGAPKAKVGEDSIRLVIGGLARFPRNARAAILNVTATNVEGPTYVTVWPDGEVMPATSNLNVFAGQTVANLVICRLGTNGALQLASPVAACDLIADVLGYFVD